RSEWTKLRTLRSTYWCLIVAAVLGIGVGALISALSASHYATDPSVHLGWNPTDRSLRSLLIAQLAFAVLGVIIVSGEYSTGMIRTSLAAVPKRIRMFSAKYLVFTAVVLLAGEIISFVTYLVGQALISGNAPSSNLGDHLVLRAVIGAGLYLALLALVSAAIGTIFRHAAAGIGVIIAILLVLPGVGQALPESWSQPIEKYWPTNAGERVVILVRDPHTLAAWTGFLDMAVFTALVIALAWWLLERRDA
ncbi:MAG: ABC transporter permease, partial [Acidimicrobiales bacterium]